MPNYCENELRVSGPDVDAFVEHAAGPDTHLSLDRLCPEPDHGSIGDSDTWYAWRLLHWGTKWDADEVDIRRSAGEATYTFVTAWAPPIGAIQSASLDWPTLTFTLSYAEGGADYAGQTVLEAGTCLEERSGSYLDLIEPGGGTYKSLSDGCRDLALSQQHLQTRQLRGSVDTASAAAIAATPAALETLVTLDDVALSSEYVNHPATSFDTAWRLGVLTLRNGHGGATIKALERAHDPLKAAAGTLLRVLGSAIEPGNLLATNHDRRRTDGALTELHNWLTLADTHGTSGDWVSATISLAAGWAGDDAGELCRTAWLLVTT